MKVAIGSLLGPVLADIFMIELEKAVAITRINRIYQRRKLMKLSAFTESTLGYFPVNLLHIFRAPFPKNTSGRLRLLLSFVKLGTINYIITKLNGFDDNIQFTLEEDKGALPFLDFLIHRECNSTVTTVFSKPQIMTFS